MLCTTAINTSDTIRTQTRATECHSSGLVMSISKAKQLNQLRFRLMCGLVRPEKPLLGFQDLWCQKITTILAPFRALELMLITKQDTIKARHNRNSLFTWRDACMIQIISASLLRCWPNSFFRTTLTKNRDFFRINSQFQDIYRPEIVFFYFKGCSGRCRTRGNPEVNLSSAHRRVRLHGRACRCCSGCTPSRCWSREMRCRAEAASRHGSSHAPRSHPAHSIPTEHTSIQGS